MSSPRILSGAVKRYLHGSHLVKMTYICIFNSTAELYVMTRVRPVPAKVAGG